MVQIQDPRPQFSGLQKGDPIPIDGELVKGLLDNAVGASIRLIKDVDLLLVSHQGGCNVAT